MSDKLFSMLLCAAFGGLGGYLGSALWGFGFGFVIGGVMFALGDAGQKLQAHKESIDKTRY